MWLDRLSGQSTPSPSPPPIQKRSYSPAPGRSSHLAPVTAIRPPYGPRTSSLGIGSRPNNSSTPLNSPRVPNGSSLRQQIVPPTDNADPLDALRNVLGKKLDNVVDGQVDGPDTTRGQKPPHLVEDVDFDGLSLHTFAESVSQEETENSQCFTTQTVEECEYVYPSTLCFFSLD